MTTRPKKASGLVSVRTRDATTVLTGQLSVVSEQDFPIISSFRGKWTAATHALL